MGLFGGNKHKMTAEEIRKQRTKENEIFENKDEKNSSVKIDSRGRIEYKDIERHSTFLTPYEQRRQDFLEKLKQNGPNYIPFFNFKMYKDNDDRPITENPSIVMHAIHIKEMFEVFNKESNNVLKRRLPMSSWYKAIEEFANEFEKVRFPYTTENQYLDDLRDFVAPKIYEKIGCKMKPYYFCFYSGYANHHNDWDPDNEYFLYYSPDEGLAKYMFQEKCHVDIYGDLACSKMFTEEEWIAEDMENKWTGAEYGPAVISGFLPFGLSRNAGKPYRSESIEANQEKEDIENR